MSFYALILLFTETQAKLDFLKAEVSRFGNVSILDGTVEEFEGVKFGGTMAFNDFNWAYKVEPEPEGNMAKFLSYWKRWFDYRHWEYMGNVHKDILASQMKKLDYVVSQKPDIIMTHYIPTFFGSLSFLFVVFLFTAFTRHLKRTICFGFVS